MRSEDYRNDPMFLRNQFSGDGVFSLPKLKIDEIDLENVRLIGYDKLNERQTDAIVHFFLDDYKFEVLWNDPAPRLERLQQYRAVLSPDFSMYTEMPLPLKIYNTFRSRWCGAFLQANGVKVIPTVSWGAPDTFWFCFDGIPKGSIVAVSTVGVRKQKPGFLVGYDEMLRRIRPRIILCYGTPFEEMRGDVISIDYAETNNYKKQILTAHVAGALHSGFVCKTGCVLADKGGRGGAAGGGSGGGGTSPTGNSGGEGDSATRNKLPPNDSQLKHMFAERKGHIPDTPENRQLLEDVANDPNCYLGTTSPGLRWYARMREDGSQVWVTVYDHTIQNGGINDSPIFWDSVTGLNRMKGFAIMNSYSVRAYLAFYKLIDSLFWETKNAGRFNVSLASLESELSPYTFRGRISADPADYIDYEKWLRECVAVSGKEDAATGYEAAKTFLAYFQENYGFAFGDSLQTMSFERYRAFFDSVDPSPFLNDPDD